MSDDASRPQYGEYATPEQQRAAIRQPLPEREIAPAMAPATTVVAQPTRTADRVITIALLAYGLFTVLSALPQLLDFPSFAQSWMGILGIEDEFTNVDQGRLWGGIGAALYVAGWLGTALLSWRMLRARRIAWWIPLVGGIVTTLAVSMCLMVPLVGDPAIAGHFL